MQRIQKMAAESPGSHCASSKGKQTADNLREACEGSAIAERATALAHETGPFVERDSAGVIRARL
ncbi:MAG: hypothetical protein Q8L54_09215 [Devosia sp.]|nr:hypothetical protein [Devosia sp.]